MKPLRHRVTALLAVALVFATQTAHADGPSSAEAETRFKEAATLAKQGKYEEALTKYVQSYALEPRPSVLLGMALAEYELRRDVDAIRHLRTYLRDPKARNVEELKSKFLVPLNERTGHLHVVAPSGLQIAIDGETVTPIDDVVDVKPGSHVLTAGDERREATVAKGQTMEVDLRPPPAPSLTPPNTRATTSPLSPPPREAEEERWGTGQYVGLGLMGVGLAGVVTGAGFAIAKSNANDDVERLESFTGPNGERCGLSPAPRACADIDGARADRDRNATLSTVFLVGGGAALVGGAVAFLVSPHRKVERTAGVVVTPHVGWRSVGVELRY